MQNTKLVKILKTFSAQEIKDFEKFISSPYFQHERNLKPLYKLLRKFHPEYDSSKLSKENFFRKLYPGKKFDRKSSHKIEVLISELTTMAEKFIAFEIFQKHKDGFRMYEAQVDAYFDRRLYSFVLNILKKSEDCIQKSSDLTEYFYDMSMINRYFHFYNLLNNDEKKCYTSSQKATLYDFGYMLNVLLWAVNIYDSSSTRFVVDPEYSELLKMGFRSFDPEIFNKHCRDDGKGSKQIIILHYYLLKSYIYIYDNKSLTNAIEYYKTNFDKFNWAFKFQLLFVILNLCRMRRRINNVINYLGIENDIVDFAIDNELYSHIKGRIMYANTYIHYFITKMALRNSAELEKFAEKVIDKVEEEQRDWLYDYSYAIISFLKKNYNKTLEYASKLNISYMAFKSDVIRLNILSLYSLGHIEEAIYKLDSLEHFIRNNRNILTRYRELLKVFLSSMRLLIKYRSNPNKANKNIPEKILALNNEYFNFWFTTEVEKLKR